MIELARAPPPRASPFRIPHSRFRIPHVAFRIPHSLPSAGLDDPLHMQSPPREIAYGRKGDMPLPNVPERDPMSARLGLPAVSGQRASQPHGDPRARSPRLLEGVRLLNAKAWSARRAPRGSPVRGEQHELPYIPHTPTHSPAPPAGPPGARIPLCPPRHRPRSSPS